MKGHTQTNMKFDEDDYELMREMGISKHDHNNKSDGPIEHGENLNIVTDPKVVAKQQQWLELCSFLETWFYKPDLDALKICLSVYAAHTYIENDPIWLFVISPPGSGKTSVAIRALSFLPNTYSIGDIGVNSFLSGYGENNGLLGNLTAKHNGNGVILFPDFTSLLSKRFETKLEIMGQMRQIYDGSYSKSVGNKAEIIKWDGKVTCIAAVTPVLENYWGTLRSLGERFLNIRWNQPGGLEVAEYAERQIHNEDFIRDKFKLLVDQYVDVDTLKKVTIEPKRELGLKSLAYMISLLRANITRDKHYKIVGVDAPETLTRIHKSMVMIALGSATLDRRASINGYDLELAKRVAIDSIDQNRGKVVAELLEGQLVDGKIIYERTTNELRKLTKLPKALLSRVIEDLVELEIVEVEERLDYKLITLTKNIETLWDRSIGFGPHL